MAQNHVNYGGGATERPMSISLYYPLISELIRDALTVNARLLSAKSGHTRVRPSGTKGTMPVWRNGDCLSQRFRALLSTKRRGA